MARFNRLRHAGPLGSFAANILTLITANWQVVLSIIAAVAAGTIGWLRALISNPATIASISAFLAVLWTTIGALYIVDRRRPREVRAHVDYRYGLTFEGLQPRYHAINEEIPNAGRLSFAFMVRNFSPSPICYQVQSIDLRLGTRAVPRILPGTVYGFMARGAGRTSIVPGFSKEEMTEFYKNNSAENHAKGTAEIVFSYGDPDLPPARKMSISIEFYLIIIKNGMSIGWQDAIISEKDEPINP